MEKLRSFYPPITITFHMLCFEDQPVEQQTEYFPGKFPCNNNTHNAILVSSPTSLVQVCSSCRTTKPSTEFYTNKTAADMLHSLCKQCHGDKCRSRASGNYDVSVADKVAFSFVMSSLYLNRPAAFWRPYRLHHHVTGSRTGVLVTSLHVHPACILPCHS